MSFQSRHQLSDYCIMTTTKLKILALIFMTIDHIGELIPDMPIWFHWIGRMSAPIFFFCAAEGIYHSSDKKQYIKRLWKMSLLMVLIEAVLPPLAEMYFGIAAIHFSNNIFLSIFLGTLLVYLLEKSKFDKTKRIKYISFYTGYQILILILVIIWERLDNSPLNSIPVLCDLERIIFTALGSFGFMEGNIILTSAIVLFYFCRNNKKKLCIWYSAYCALYFLIFVPELPIKAIHFMSRCNVPNAFIEIVRTVGKIAGFQTIFSAGNFINSLLNVNYQWMMIFALPFLLIYNGKRGKGLKKLFYIYYPVHLVILSIIGCTVNS